MQSSRILSIGVLLLLAACSGDSSPSGPRDAESSDGPDGDGSASPAVGADGPAPPTAGAIVSAAVPRSLLAFGLAGSGSLVFVSATPGSFPGEVRAHIVGSRGDSAVALVHEGGFDPVPVEGTTGELHREALADGRMMAPYHWAGLSLTGGL